MKFLAISSSARESEIEESFEGFFESVSAQRGLSKGGSGNEVACVKMVNFRSQPSTCRFVFMGGQTERTIGQMDARKPRDESSLWNFNAFFCSAKEDFIFVLFVGRFRKFKISERFFRLA